MDRPAALYMLYCMVSAQKMNLSTCDSLKVPIKMPLFSSKVVSAYVRPLHNAQVPMVVQ